MWSSHKRIYHHETPPPSRMRMYFTYEKGDGGIDSREMKLKTGVKIYFNSNKRYSHYLALHFCFDCSWTWTGNYNVTWSFSNHLINIHELSGVKTQSLGSNIYVNTRNLSLIFFTYNILGINYQYTPSNIDYLLHAARGQCLFKEM